MGSASDLVGFAFEVTGAEAERLPARIVEALQSKAVQDAIKNALDQQAKKLLAAQTSPKPADPKLAETVAKNLGEATFTAVSKEVQRAIEQSSGVKKLQEDAKQVLKNFECSPVGVWVNQNRTLVYVVGAVLALAGGAAMYFTKSGDDVAKFVEGKGKTFKLGTIEIKGQLTQFKPSSQTVGVEVGASGNWKWLKADLKIAGTAVGTDGKVTADGKIVVPLSGQLSAVTFGKIDLGRLPNSPEPRQLQLSQQAPTLSRFNYSAAAGLTFKNDSLSLELLALVDNGKPGGSFTTSYNQTWGDWRFQAGAGVQVKPGMYSGQGTLGLSNAGKRFPMGFNLAGQLNNQGVYSITGNLELRFF